MARVNEKEKEEEIQKHMKLLDISREEAEELWRFDHDLEDNEEATALEKKVKESGIMRTVHEATAVGKKTQKERVRKENPEKAEIIAEIAEKLQEFGENVTITNKERQISFKIGENDYEITLVMKRKAKK